MLATHNSMTYLPAAQWWARPLARWWRCQHRAIAEQYAAGVRQLDIRIRRDARDHWRVCHGAVDLAIPPQLSINSLLAPIILAAPDATIRLVLERDRGSDASLLAALVPMLPPAVTEVCVKSPWRVIKTDTREAHDHYFKPIDTARPWWRQLRAVASALWLCPRSYARRHPIPADHRSDGAIHYHDYV